MSVTHIVADRASGVVLSVQTVPDSYAPVLGNLPNQTVASNVSAGVLSSGTLANTAAPGLIVLGNMSVTISGTFNADIRLQRSFDGGTTFTQCIDEAGHPIAISVPGEMKFSETEPGVLYRVAPVNFVSGTWTYRYGRG